MAEMDFYQYSTGALAFPILFRYGDKQSNGTTPVWVYHTVVTAANLNALLYLWLILNWCL